LYVYFQKITEAKPGLKALFLTKGKQLKNEEYAHHTYVQFSDIFSQNAVSNIS
jgi:hypothetical protein